MRFVKLRSGFLVLALAAAFVLQSALTAEQVYACSCAGSTAPKEELESSDAVFVGKAVENGLEDPDPRDDVPFGGIRFEVSKVWKGVPEDSVVIYGQSGSYYGPPEEGEMMVENTCAVPFTQGKTYLVYASRMEDSDFLQANACGRTGTLTSAEEDVEALGPATDQLPDTGGPGVSDALAVGITVILVIALVGAAAARELRRDQESYSTIR
jgi:hypothetical protein